MIEYLLGASRLTVSRTLSVAPGSGCRTASCASAHESLLFRFQLTDVPTSRGPTSSARTSASETGAPAMAASHPHDSTDVLYNPRLGFGAIAAGSYTTRFAAVYRHGASAVYTRHPAHPRYQGSSVDRWRTLDTRWAARLAGLGGRRSGRYHMQGC